ncbi:MAG: hypothetical protein N3B01_06745 [Verrucomicrobiae bacterium]|nr:hypothetical protein [Verrucomicrobiae bacterium]
MSILPVVTAKVSHARSEESMEAKARWFQSLTLQERMELFCAFVDLALTVNPQLRNPRHAEPIEGRVRVLTAE